MRPEKFLQSNMLDILFENKNKEYGAYELRTHYNNRLGKSIGITAALVVLLCIGQSFKVPHRTGMVVLEKVPDVKLTDVTLHKDDPIKPKEKPQIKRPVPKPAQPNHLAVAMNITPVIVKNVETTVKTIDDLKDKLVGTKDVVGTATAPGENGHPSETMKGSGTGDKPVEIVEAGPLVHAEHMPEFPGGVDALIKFIQRNAKQPDDMEEGQKIVVLANFVVDENGNIVDVRIIQSGRKDLDAEVIRVIKKMPQWKAGTQNGRAVPVYFKLPITFMSND
jgi:protein TonB